MNPVEDSANSAELLAALFGLHGQTAIITGGGAGLGRDLSHMFARAGAQIIVADIQRENAEAVKLEIEQKGGVAEAVHVDVTNEASVQALFDFALQAAGGATILVNNVGVYPNRPLLEMSVDDWQFVQDVNLKGTFLCTREAVKQMMALGKGGRIVNISSIASVHPALHGNAHYCASKAGVNMFTKEVALEVAEYGINVNALLPGGVMTETRAKRVASTTTWRGPATDSKRFLLGTAPPWKHAVGALFLASPGAAHITGHTLVADGGFLIS